MTDATETKASLFVPGARVAVDNNGSFRESFVDRVHKNGNFTLRGSSQQWRPYQNTARPTGDSSWMRPRLQIWDETNNARIRSAIAAQNRLDRIRIIRARLDNTKSDEITDEQLTAIEAALPQKEKK